MGAISLYRGNLHRVPHDVPRRWLMPTPAVSIKDFRHLLNRRNKCFSHLPSTSAPTQPAKPKPPTIAPPPPPQQDRGGGDASNVVENLNSPDEGSGRDDVEMVEVRVEDGGDSRPLDQTLALVVKEKEIFAPADVVCEIPATQGNGKLDDESEERKRQVKEKLQNLIEKKHSLVQALKQILNAEEELKRRSSVQANRPPLPLQVDASNDSGSMTRHATPRTGSDANATVHMEIGEGDDPLNPNPQSRQLARMNSTSPCAESALRRPYFHHNPASYPSRAAMVAAGSPSRFAPTGNQGLSSSLPTVSVTGTNYVASSPSPAASGGTSVFRDARHPSPWK